MTLGVIIGGLTASIVIEWVVTLLIGMMGFLCIEPTIQKKLSQAKKKLKLTTLKVSFFVPLQVLPALLVIMEDHRGKFLLYRWVLLSQFSLAPQS